MTSELMAFYSVYDDFDAWRAALAVENVELRQANDITDTGRVRQALVWKPPHGFFARFPNLGLVVNLGAGVDALVRRDGQWRTMLYFPRDCVSWCEPLLIGAHADLACAHAAAQPME